jgi:hypothetical protein
MNDIITTVVSLFDKTNSNINNNLSNKYTSSYWTLDNEEIKKIRKNYDIIDVDYLDPILTMYNARWINKLDEKRLNITKELLDYHLEEKNAKIYEKTNYLCNRKERICICNTHANDLRKIFDGINYKEETYVNWIKKTNDPF